MNVQSRHIPELDGLRGIAVGLVLLTHFWPNVGHWRVALPFTEIGWVGVDLFFVLSGFLITGILFDSVGHSSYYKTFYIRRAFRIFPLYYVFLILVLGFLAIWHQGHDLDRLRAEWGSPAWFFAYLANYVSTIRGNFPPFAPLGPLWSLQIEEQFYVVFPSIVLLLRSKLWIALITMVIGSLVWRVSMLISHPENPMIQYAGTLSRLDGLALGGFGALLVRRAEGSRLTNATAWLAPVSLVVLAIVYFLCGSSAAQPFTRTFGFTLNALASIFVIIWTVQRRGQPASALFRVAPARWLGKISYGVYLLQLPVQSAIKMITGAPIGSPKREAGQCFVWLMATLAVAWISWRYFEKPLQVWGHRVASGNAAEVNA